MQNARLWARITGVETIGVVEAVREDLAVDAVVVTVRPTKGNRNRCGLCGARSPRYDAGEGLRRWRSLDAGTVTVYIEAEGSRVSCDEHGVTVAAVPWARHNTGHTRRFDDYVAWLAAHTSKTAVVALVGVTWRTVGAIVGRVVAEARKFTDPFDGLSRIGIDEISFKRGHKYLTVVVDHDSGRLVWAAVGRDKATLTKFFVTLGPQRCAQIRLVSGDAAEWIATVVGEQCPAAELCADPFHMVAWATEALDEVRRALWRDARRVGVGAIATRIKGCRYALLKNPDTLTDTQHESLAQVQRMNKTLYRAYLLKEQFRLIFQLRGDEAIIALNGWLSWAKRCRIAEFVRLAGRIERHRTTIVASLTHGLSNALIESTNTKLRLLFRVAFGFQNTDNMIALCYLDRGGYCPTLPGRPPKQPKAAHG